MGYKESKNKFDVPNTLNNKRDIVIVGDWGVENYGANLTYYALYKAIIEMGLNPLMVERTLDAPWKPKENPTLFSKLPYDECHILKYRNNRIELKELNNYSSTFLVGSDQLFNSGLYHAFGKFINLNWVKSNKRKIVYGASFGSNSQLLTESDRAELQFYLKQFDFVSVREYHAKQFMKEKLTVNCEWVLDPVFLCDPFIYSELALKSKMQRPFKYVGAYVLEPTDDKINTIERISDELNCEYYISTDALYEQKEIDKQSWGNRIRKGLFVEDFVAQIYHSEFFITDSFHGTCLAILLHKPFVTILNDTRGADRFYSLLKLLKLEDRLFKNINEFTNCSDILSRQIDYDKVDSILCKEKEKSKKWLINSIFSSVAPKSISQYDVLDDRLDEIIHEESRYRLLVENHFKEIEKNCFQMDIDEQEYRRLVEEHFHCIEQNCTNMDEDEKEYRYCVENQLRDIEAKIDYLNESLLLTNKELGEKEIELNKILSSKTYILGERILFIPKKIKNMFANLKRK
jgi:polysaccharide pyruvyl transferase WcaK-like protein